MKHENFYERYNEIMFDERDVIKNFLEQVGGMWKFEDIVILAKNTSAGWGARGLRLVEGNLEIDTCYGWEDYTCFAYGELSKIIDALPEIDEVVNIMDTTNSHDKKLVEIINSAWRNGSKKVFATIVYAIAMRDYEECENLTPNMEEFLSSIIDNCDKNAIHVVLQNICDNQDLRTILLFVK